MFHRPRSHVQLFLGIWPPFSSFCAFKNLALIFKSHYCQSEHNSALFIESTCLVLLLNSHFYESKLHFGFLCIPKTLFLILTLYDMTFFEPSVMGEGAMRAPSHHNFVVIAPMIMKFGTGISLRYSTQW